MKTRFAQEPASPPAQITTLNDYSNSPNPMSSANRLFGPASFEFNSLFL